MRLGRVIAYRLATGLLVLLIVASAVFGLLFLVPGDAASSLAGDDASPERIEEISDSLGLNDPFYEQYGRWLGNAVQGDFGRSLITSQEVTSAIAQRLPATISLTVAALVVALVVAVPAATIAAVRHGTWLDRLITTGASIGIALPNFWIGLLLLLVFAVRNSWLPAVGYVPLTEDPFEWLQRIILPATALGMAAAAEVTRQLRASLTETLKEDYIRTGRAMGLPRRSIIGKHALKNAAAPVVTVLGVRLAILLGGTAVIEQVFGIPGLGQLAVRATLLRDIPLVQGVVLVSAIVVILTNLVVDLLYAWLNPKVAVK